MKYYKNQIFYPDPPHFVRKLGVELKIVIWSDSFSVRFLDKNFVLGAR